MYSIPAIVLDELIEVEGTAFEPPSIGGGVHPSGCSLFRQLESCELPATKGGQTFERSGLIPMIQWTYMAAPLLAHM